MRGIEVDEGDWRGLKGKRRMGIEVD